ncbi:MAG: polyprenyl diphosphate synthase [Spirochaetia bacterium]|nr:polyprenyl diphosphate synthase [Spirochaetia bacterium]MCI7564786.1 polyprenyl diphosphate synthase [Spirochaetia bacterium]
MNTETSTLPIHIGIIMDGNGRWAKLRNLPRTKGHREGLDVAKQIVKAASDLGIKFVTLYTFSTENWKRTQEEVGYLMTLIKKHLSSEFNFYKENKIRIEHIGDITALPMDVQTEIKNAKNDTKDFTGTTVLLAINYGGKDEIIRGIKKLASQKKDFSSITEQDLSLALDTKNIPDVDLLIRTGGELRLSNFLLWQAAYAELIFTDTLWPDYTKEEFIKNIQTFQHRTRRFGGIK